LHVGPSEAAPGYLSGSGIGDPLERLMTRPFSKWHNLCGRSRFIARRVTARRGRSQFVGTVGCPRPPPCDTRRGFDHATGSQTQP